MTREDILKEYKINKNGIIISAGKFEGEMLYIPYFWDWYLNGEGLSSGIVGDHRIFFSVYAEDLLEFPELEGVEGVVLDLREDGFIQGSFAAKEDIETWS